MSVYRVVISVFGISWTFWLVLLFIGPFLYSNKFNCITFFQTYTLFPLHFHRTELIISQIEKNKSINPDYMDNEANMDRNFGFGYPNIRIVRIYGFHAQPHYWVGLGRQRQNSEGRSKRFIHHGPI